MKDKNDYGETCLDIYRGQGAGRFIWRMENEDVNCFKGPDERHFYECGGKRFWRSLGWENQMRRQKDCSKGLILTDYHKVEYVEKEEGELDVFIWRTPDGELVGRRHNGHFVEYPVKTIADVDKWRFIAADASYRLNPARKRCNVELMRRAALNWSPAQQLLQFDMGVENFYYLLCDCSTRMMELMDTMQTKKMEQLRLILDNCPELASFYWGENTSSSMISPDYYAKISLPHIREYAECLHSRDIRLIVHMCGNLKDLLPHIAESQMDGIDSLTPPPVGDTPFNLVRERFKPDFTIIGRMNACHWVGKDKSEILKWLEAHIDSEICHSPFILLVTTDALPDIPYDDAMSLFEALNEFGETISSS